MNELEKKVLVKLAGERQGRMGWPRATHDAALPYLQTLIDEGYVVERRFYSFPGFQITAKGREYLGGVST